MFSGEDDITTKSSMLLRVKGILYQFNKNSKHWSWDHGKEKTLLVKPRLIRDWPESPFPPITIPHFSSVLNTKLAVVFSIEAQNSINLLFVYKNNNLHT